MPTTHLLVWRNIDRDAALVDIKNARNRRESSYSAVCTKSIRDLVVIMMTGYASVETAVTALKNGAYDYVTKRSDPDGYRALIKNALAHKRTTQENVLLRRKPSPISLVQETSVGQSGLMPQTLQRD